MKNLATFGMGCFWTPQLMFSETPGVIKAVAGYMGGNEKLFPAPNYEQVCSNSSGFAEVTQITFNPEKISYSELLEIFWKNHNPTEKDKQGADIGNQYRSIIFFHTKEQEILAESSKIAVQKKFSKKIQTKIGKAKTFFPAEDYHQDFLKKSGQHTCHI